MSLIVKIGADIREFDREMRRMTRDINGVATKLGNAGKTMTTALTAPLAGIGVVAAKTGMEFEASMSQVAATLGTTSDKIGDLEKLAMDMGSTTKFSASEAAEGINFMAMAGWKTQDIMKGLPAVLNLAAAGGMELGAASDIVTDAMTGMGIGADGAEAFVDLMAKTSSNANTSVRDMGAAMILTAGQANSLAIDQKDLAQAIGLMANAGFKGEIAGQHLSAGIRMLVNPTKKQQKYMEKYGVELQKNAEGGMDLGATMEHLRDKLGGLDRVTQSQVASVLLGADAQKSWSAIVNASEEDFNKLSDAIANSEGAGKQMADTMSDNLQGRMKAMQSALEGVAIQIYEYLQPALEKIVSGITKLATAFSKLDPKTQTFIIALAALVAATGPLLVAFAAVMKMIAFVKGALTLLGTVTMASVGIWIAVGLAIAALVLAIIIYWDEIKAVTIAVWNAIADFMKVLWEGVVDVAKTIWSGLTSFFSDLWGSITADTQNKWNGVKDFLSNLWSSITSKTEEAWNGIKDFFSEWGLTILAVITGPIGWLVGLIVMYWDQIKSATTTAWNGIKEFLSTIWNGIVSIFGPIFSAILGIITSVWNGIYGATKAVWDFIIQYLKAIWDAIMFYVQPVFDRILAKISEVWNQIKAVTSLVWTAIKAALTSVWNSISSTVSSVWNKIKSVTTSVWNAIKSVLLSIWKNISSTATSVWNSISSFFTKWLNIIKSKMSSVWNAIKSAMASIWNAIRATAVSVWNATKNAVMGPINSLKSSAINAFNSLKSKVTSVWNSIRSTALSIWSSISSSVSSTVSNLVGKVGGAFSGLKSTVVGAWEGIKSGIKSVINSIIGMVNKFIGGFNTPAKALNKIPGVDAPTIPKIPMLATGGTIFGSGQAIVGEAGPELVSKSGSSVKVTPLSSQEKAGGIGGAMGGSGGGVVEVPVSLDGKVIARVVAPYMDNQLRGRRDSKNRAKGGW